VWRVHPAQHRRAAGSPEAHQQQQAHDSQEQIEDGRVIEAKRRLGEGDLARRRSRSTRKLIPEASRASGGSADIELAPDERALR